ncbi:hypothetical protein QE152_g38689 [Popillia japonica]|uniref:Uncharacterized protein n=1 Tax=Popillia japonica TaxID=7064 RepID=A0AAW1HWQ4_POPJA
MATIPSSLLIKSLDEEEFPPQTVIQVKFLQVLENSIYKGLVVTSVFTVSYIATMATIPSSLLIKSLDEEEFPPQSSLQLFRYGVKSLVMKGSQVHVSLSYTPKTDTLIKKIGTLPLEYIRLALESPEEVAIFEKAMAKYSFSIRSDSEEVEEALSGKKKIKYDD